MYTTNFRAKRFKWNATPQRCRWIRQLCPQRCLANFRPANFCLGNSLVAVNPVRNFDHETVVRKNMGKVWEQMMISP